MNPRYDILSFTLNHQPQPLDTYKHDAPFIEGDTRIIQYQGDNFEIEQTFHGSTATGGWYDEA